MVCRFPCGPIGCACEPGHGRHEPAIGLAGRYRRLEARRQRGGRGDRGGGGAQRHGTAHDGHRRRRVRDDLFLEEQETRRTQCEWTRAPGAEPGLFHLTEDHRDAACRHGGDHRPGRVRRMDQPARQVRHDEARGPDGARHRLCRKRVPGDGEDRRRLGARGAEAAADRGGRVHLSHRRRRATSGCDVHAEEPGADASRAGTRRARRVLSRRDRGSHRGVLPGARRLSFDAGLRVAQVRMGRADFDHVSGSHAVRAAAERPGADRAPPAEHAGRHRPAGHAVAAGALLSHDDRGDQDRLCRSQPVHRRSGVRDDSGARTAFEGVCGQAAGAHRSEHGDRCSSLRQYSCGSRHHLLHHRRPRSERGVVHQQHLLRVWVRDRGR